MENCKARATVSCSDERAHFAHKIKQNDDNWCVFETEEAQNNELLAIALALKRTRTKEQTTLDRFENGLKIKYEL